MVLLVVNQNDGWKKANARDAIFQNLIVQSVHLSECWPIEMFGCYQIMETIYLDIGDIMFYVLALLVVLIIYLQAISYPALTNPEQ